jgi:3-hydroxyisobutyrate dehydrogenase
MKKIRCVGFVGLGRMGWPMAGHLVRAGFDLVVYDVRDKVVSDFVAENGGRVADDLTGVGRGADAVVTMVPTSAHVREVVLGADGAGGVAGSLAAGAVVIDTGASDPVQTRALGEALRPRGVHVVDAPVAGGVAFARDGTLDVMVGGEPDVIERIRPVLDAFGSRVHTCGGLGNAHAMKALNNYVNAAGIVALVEALTVGRRLGLDLDMMLESIAAATTGRNHPLDKKILPQVITHRFAHGAAIGLMAKDVRIALDSAVASEAWAPMAERCASLWEEAVQVLGFDADQTEVARLWEERTGVSLARED